MGQGVILSLTATATSNEAHPIGAGAGGLFLLANGTAKVSTNPRRVTGT